MMLSRLISSGHFYTVVYTAALFLTVFNVSEIVFLLLHKRHVEREDRRKELLKRSIATTLVTGAEAGTCLPVPRSHMEFEAYAEAAGSVIESFEGEMAARAGALVHKMGVDLHYKRLYRSLIWYKRAHAIDTLISLKLKRNREFFSAMFRAERTPEVKYRLVYGLSSLVRDAADIRVIASMLAGMPYLTAKFNEDVFYNAISTLKISGKEAEFGVFMMNALHDISIPELVKRDCISACHVASCDKAAPVIREYFLAFHGHPEILMACIKSLVRMGETWMLRQSLLHEDWRVRLVALKYAHLSAEDTISPARTLLRDPNYHVRLNAAISLASHGEQGIAVLLEELRSGDKYAASAARFGLDSAKGAA